MQPEDPRHGTYAGAVAHWFDDGRPCAPCARAETRYRKQRKLDALRGNPRTVPAIGIVRRIHALHALGWSGRQIADAAGASINTLRAMQYHDSERVHRATADRVIAAYESLAMRRPDGGYADRQRTMARRKGWAPPLAWDDIDDPDEQPTGHMITALSTTVARADTLADLHDRGAGVSEACRVLDVTRSALEKWCARHGLADLHRALVAREQGCNPWTERSA